MMKSLLLSLPHTQRPSSVPSLTPSPYLKHCLILRVVSAVR